VLELMDTRHESTFDVDALFKLPTHSLGFILKFF
jgi:hypothetical protein